MAITSSQNNAEATLRLATGSYLTDGAAAAINIDCGFTPRYVKVFNETSGDQYEWNQTMANAEAFKRVAAGTGSFITTLGITPSTSTSTFRGFTIGLDLDINVTAETLSWIAIG